MELTQEDRILLIKEEAIRQKHNKRQSNYSKSKARLRLERLEQVSLLMKSGIHEEDAFDIAREEQRYDNDLTYLMKKAIKDMASMLSLSRMIFPYQVNMFSGEFTATMSHGSWYRVFMVSSIWWLLTVIRNQKTLANGNLLRFPSTIGTKF